MAIKMPSFYNELAILIRDILDGDQDASILSRTSDLDFNNIPNDD